MLASRSVPTNRRSKRRRAAKRPTLAQRADPFVLYQRSVQAPEVDVRLFRRFYRENFPGREPLVMREDFCAAASMACEWVKSSYPRVAHGVDLDPAPLEWGRRHNLAALAPRYRERVHLHQGDVRHVRTPPADTVNALNFSYCVLKRREDLRDYFRAAWRSLKREGTFVLDLFGGYEVVQVRSDPAVRHGSFWYQWEQHAYDPITHEGTYFIHFKFQDGSRLRRAFRYDWRLWTIAEVREVLLEAGFARADVYWEDADDDGEGTGVWRRKRNAEPEAAWVVYIVGVKK